MNDRMRTAANYLVVAAAAVYATSFFLPALNFDGPLPGWIAFPLTALVVPIPMCLANSFFLCGLAKAWRRQWQAVRFAGLTASVLGLLGLLLVWPDILIGFVLWGVSMLMLFLAGQYMARGWNG